jgi:hypothetical protein
MNAVTEQVKLPALALVIVGVLDVGFVALFVLSNLVQLVREPAPRVFASEAQRAGYYLWQVTAWGAALATACAAPLIIYGGIQMMRLRRYGVAKVASILALLPLTSCCCLVGVPVGIWSLRTLARPDVKAAFDGGPPAGG